MFVTTRRALSRALLAGLFAVVLCATVPARAADPIKIGFSMALTGAVAPQSPNPIEPENAASSASATSAEPPKCGHI